MTQTIRRGRPLGTIARATLDALREQPATVHGLAVRLQISQGDAKRTVARLATSGYVRYGDSVPGRYQRPVSLVTLAAPEPASEAMPWWLFNWPR